MIGNLTEGMAGQQQQFGEEQRNNCVIVIKNRMKSHLYPRSLNSDLID